MSHDEKLTRILKCASEIFATKGYHNASVRDVAAETGVSPAGLYYYFRSKEQLLYLILEASLTRLLTCIKREIRKVEDTTLRLKIIVRCHLQYLQDHPHEMRVIVHDWEALSGSFAQSIRRLMKEYADLLTRTFQDLAPGANSREARAAAFGLFGMLSWVDQWYRPGRDLPMEVLADRFASTMVEGFLAGAKTGPNEKEATERGDSDPAGRKWGTHDTKSTILSGPGF